MQSQWISFGNAFVVLYDITKRTSFDRVKTFHSKILMVKDCDVKTQPPIIVVGNKTDLEDEREVSTEEGQQAALSLGATFFETSALKNTNISETFIEIIRQIRVYYDLNGSGEQANPVDAIKKKKSFCTML